MGEPRTSGTRSCPCPRGRRFHPWLGGRKGRPSYPCPRGRRSHSCPGRTQVTEGTRSRAGRPREWQVTGNRAPVLDCKMQCDCRDAAPARDRANSAPGQAVRVPLRGLTWGHWVPPSPSSSPHRHGPGYWNVPGAEEWELEFAALKSIFFFFFPFDSVWGKGTGLSRVRQSQPRSASENRLLLAMCVCVPRA